MITILLDDNAQCPLYEQLYRQIRQQIETGKLTGGEKLPSKRKMADHLQVSLRTIENAYAQLAIEGYIESIEKKAYVVREIEKPLIKNSKTTDPIPSEQPEKNIDAPQFDLKTNQININDFPFSIWTKLMRSSMRDKQTLLLEPVHPQGDPNLRQEIAHYLHQFRNMTVDPNQIIIGAGAEYLLGLVSELLPHQTFALEDPNYPKPAKILRSKRVKFVTIPLDQEGISLDRLIDTDASVVLTTPSHHFPLGTVMSANRRRQLLHWAAQNKERYLIEDDYDSEYRFALKPVPPLFSLDNHGKVIYMNTFTRTLAPSLRIAYLVLPPELLHRYKQNLMFYACTVSEIEQYTLCKFIQGGFYERHLSRMRTIYRMRRDILLKGLAPLSDRFTIQGQEAGLHLLLTSQKNIEDRILIDQARYKGIRVYKLSDYYHNSSTKTFTVIIGYAGYDIRDLKITAALLVNAWKQY